jgi:hypothetical protein
MKTAVKKKKTAKSKKAVRKTGFEDLDMKDFSKDPYVIKKREQAIEMLRRTGIILNP